MYEGQGTVSLVIAILGFVAFQFWTLFLCREYSIADYFQSLTGCTQMAKKVATISFLNSGGISENYDILWQI